MYDFSVHTHTNSILYCHIVKYSVEYGIEPHFLIPYHARLSYIGVDHMELQCIVFNCIALYDIMSCFLATYDITVLDYIK